MSKYDDSKEQEYNTAARAQNIMKTQADSKIKQIKTSQSSPPDKISFS